MSFVIIFHNIRSTHNVGAILRTAEGFGVARCYFSGYTPYPKQLPDSRLPHIAEKITKDIHKTALGAEALVPISLVDDVRQCITDLKNDGYMIVALEQDPRSVMIDTYETPKKIALLLGEEVSGIPSELRNICDDIVEIPMRGRKESFNVSVAAGIAMYELSRKHK